MPPELNLEKLSDKDLDALLKGDLNSLSDDALNMLTQVQQPVKAQTPEEGMIGLENKAKAGMKQYERAAGLVTRAGLEGLQDLGNFIVTPVRKGVVNPAISGWNAIFGTEIPKAGETNILSKTADVLNLPKPQNAIEKYGFQGAKMAAPVPPFAKLASLFKPTSRAGQGIQQALVENIPSQVAGATGFGFGSSAVQQATEGKEPSLANAGLELLAGLGGGITASGIKQSIPSIRRGLSNLIDNFTMDAGYSTTANKQMKSVLYNMGEKADKVDKGVINSVLRDITEAEKKGHKFSDEHINRLIDYRIAGATPTKGTITLNPSEITKELNLSKVGANLDDAQMQEFVNVKNKNNQIILQNFNELGANQASENMKDAGKSLQNIFEEIHNLKTSQIDELYKNAKTLDGKSALLDGKSFADDVATKLGRQDRFLPNWVKQDLKAYKEGKVPFTVEEKSAFQSQLAKAMRDAQKSDSLQYSALQEIRNSIENVQLMPNQKFGQETLDAFNQAKRITYNYKKLQEKIPALKNFSQPSNRAVNADDFFDKFIIKSKNDTFKQTYQQLDDNGKNIIKNNLVKYIKDKATGNAVADETAKVSANAFEKVMKDLGGKLNIVFTDAELMKLKSLRNVSKYDSFRPVGGAVNESNTAAMQIAQKFIPSSLKDFNKGRQAKQALNITDINSNNVIPESIYTPSFYENPKYVPSLLRIGQDITGYGQ